MEDYFEGFSEKITKWDKLRQILDLDGKDEKEKEKDNANGPKNSNLGVELLPRQDIMMYGTLPKMETKFYSKCKECRLLFNPKDVLFHKNCSGKANSLQSNLLKKKVKCKGGVLKKPVLPPPVFGKEIKKPLSPPVATVTSAPPTTTSSSIVFPELKVSVTKVVLPKNPKLTTVTSSTTPTCTTTKSSEAEKPVSSSSSKSHSSHSKSSSHHSPKSSHSHYPKSSHHRESSSHHSHSSHGHHSHSHSKSSAKAEDSGHSPSSSKYSSKHKKSKKSAPSTTSASTPSKTTTTAPQNTTTTTTTSLNSEEPGAKATTVVTVARKCARMVVAAPPLLAPSQKQDEEKEIFRQNTSYVPIVTKIVTTIETATPLITTYIMPKSTTHSRQLSTSVLASKKSNVMDTDTLKNGFISQNLDNTQDKPCVNVPIVFMPMSPISIVSPATQVSLHATIPKPEPFFLPIPSNHSKVQIYESHPKPVVMPNFNVRRVGGAIMMRNPHVKQERDQLLAYVMLNHTTTTPHRPNILSSKSLKSCKRSASDRPSASDSKQVRLISDVNGFILHADVSETAEPQRQNNVIQEKIALLNMK